MSISIVLVWSSCSDDPVTVPIAPEPVCDEVGFFDNETAKNFAMGFSTWSYGPTINNKLDTYNFISSFADIYSEQVDDKIPWKSWINGLDLPGEFLDDIEDRRTIRPANKDLILSVSLLNTDRSDLSEDVDGTTPSYFSFNDDHIKDAYYKHLKFLVDTLDPQYLIMAMEVNDLRIKSESRWHEYLLLASDLRSRLKTAYPELKVSESVTLHNWYQPDISDPNAYIAEIANHVNQLDFAAISFYPFFKGQHTQAEFQSTFDFLHGQVTIPIAFVETAHLAEDLNVEAFNLSIDGTPCEQNAYLETLITNAQHENYEFIIWWTHRDYDALWDTFPPEVQDIGRLWRDTGLIDENGNSRAAFITWRNVLWK